MKEEAQRAGMFFVTNRWLGGTLTNFRTIKGSIERLREIEKLTEDGTFDRLSKKEILTLSREQEKLESALGGIKEMTGLPGALFVIDAQKEHIAIAEARKLGIPVISIADTNSDPDVIDYVIPGNDDAIRAVKLFAAKMSDACLIGKRQAQQRRHQHHEEAADKVTNSSPKVPVSQRRGPRNTPGKTAPGKNTDSVKNADSTIHADHDKDSSATSE